LGLSGSETTTSISRPDCRISDHEGVAGDRIDRERPTLIGAAAFAKRLPDCLRRGNGRAVITEGRQVGHVTGSWPVTG